MRKIKKIPFYEVFLPLFYFFAQYDSIATNIGMVILLIYTVYQGIKKPKRKFDKYFFLITIGALIIKIIQILIYEVPVYNVFTSFFNIVFLLIVITYRKEDINILLLKKFYITFAFIFSIFIILQSYQIYFLKRTVDSIPLFPVNDIITWKINSNRPLSLFKEPQMYSTYMFPLIAILLIDKKIVLAFYFSFMVLLSASTTGIVILLGMYLYVLLTSRISLINKWILFLIMGIAIIFFIKLPFFETAMEKLSGMGNNSSDYSRLFKSFYTFEELPIEFKFLGIGEYNIRYFIEKYNYSFSWMKFIQPNGTLFEYQSSFFGIFVENGLIYAIYYYIIMACFFIKQCNNEYMKLIFITLIVQSIATGFYFNSAFYFYILLIYALKNKKDFFIEDSL